MPRIVVRRAVSLPWTWIGPRQLSGKPAQWELRIAELPDYLVVGRTREDVLNLAAEALESFLETYKDRGEEPPLPDLSNWAPARIEYKVGPGIQVAPLEPEAVVGPLA